MATINDRNIINALIANNGYYQDDPRVQKIIEYHNIEGGICWGVVWSSEPKHVWDRYDVATQFIRNPRLIWEAK